MSRRLLLLIALLLSVYLFALGWSGREFASYSSGGTDLFLTALDPRQASLDQPVSLELQGGGFDADSRVFMHMNVNNKSAEIASLPIDGGLYDMEVVDDILYLAAKTVGIRRIDVSDPRKPRISGRPYLAQTPVLDIERKDNFLYLSCATQGVRIVEITPTGLRNWKTLPSWSVAIASKVVGNYLYVAAGRSGLFIYDLQNLKEHKPVANIGTDRSFFGIEAFGNYLYLVAGRGGVLIYEISDSVVPALVGQIITEMPAKSVTITQDTLYVLENGKISQYELTEPQSPQLVAEQRHFNSPHRLHYAGDKIYVSDNQSGLGLVDNSEKRLPDVAEFLNVGGDPRGVARVGDYLYVAVSKIGIKVIDTKVILPRQVVGNVNTSGSVEDFKIIDDYIYIADSKGGLIQKNLAAENELFTNLDAGRVNSLTRVGSLLYAASARQGVTVYDVSDPTAPELYARWPELKGSHVAIDGDYMVTASGSDGLALVKVLDAGQIRVVDNINDIDVIKVFAGNGLIVAAGKREGIFFYQVTDDKLSFLSRLDLPFPLDQFSWALNLQVVGSVLYVANGEGGLLSVDIENPERPVILSSLKLPGFATELLIEGDRAYVASRYSGLHTIDISDQYSPRLLDTVEFSDLSGGVHRYDDLLYLGNRFMGVTIIPVPQELKNVALLSDKRLQIDIPPPAYPGRYSLEISGRGGSASLDGVLNYQ